MFCNMRRVGKFIINSMRQHGIQTFHMLLKMPHCTALPYTSLVPSNHPSIQPSIPFHTIRNPIRPSVQQLLAIFIYTYVYEYVGRAVCCRISTRRSVLNAYLQSLNSISDRMTTIGNSWHSKFYI